MRPSPSPSFPIRVFATRAFAVRAVASGAPDGALKTFRIFPGVLLLSALLLLLTPATALALEKKIFGDVAVGEGERADEVSTTFGDVLVEGEVEGDVRSVLGDVSVAGGTVGGDVGSGLGSVGIEAPVLGDVEAGFGDVYVDSLVGGSVDVKRGDVHLGPEARVAGDLRFGSGHVFPEEGSVVLGNQVGGMAAFDDGSAGTAGSGVLGFAGWLLAASVFAAGAVLVAVLGSRPLRASVRVLEDSPGRAALAGFVSVPLVLVVALALAVSIVGIPLLLLLAPAYLALLVFGAVVTAYFVGRRVLFATGRHRAGDALAALLGAFLVAAAHLVPVLGEVLLYLLALIGAGAAVLATLYHRRRAPATAGTPPAARGAYEEYSQDRRWS